MPDVERFSNILKKSKGLIIVNDINNTRRYRNNNNNECYDNDNQNISVDGFIGANYYFLKDNEIKQGNIITDGNPQNLEESIKKVENDLNMEAYSNYSSSFEISNQWELLTEQKFDWRLEYENEWYGDFSEWGCHYIYEYNGVRYHLQTRESYITPGNDTDPNLSGLETTDFRSGAIEYIMEKPEGIESDFQLRDYAPKAQNPEWIETSGISGSFSFSVGSSGISVGTSLSASFSYSCSYKSPNVLDYSNISQNKLDIKFEYFEPFDVGDEQNFQYNTHTSMQLCMNVWKENIISPDNEGDCVDRRAITMMKDCWWIWDDRTVTFNYDIYGRL